MSFDFFTNIFNKIGHLFSSSKAQAALHDVAVIVNGVTPIVKDLQQLIPNKTFQEVTAAYQKYAVPFAAAETNDPVHIGNYIMNLAVAEASKHWTAVPFSSLAAAVNLAYVAVKNS